MNLIPFPKNPHRKLKRQPHIRLRRRTRNLLKLYAKDMLTRTALCDLFAEFLPEGVWVDCGDYYICLTYTSGGYPAVRIRGRRFSKSGACPRCGAKRPHWVLGEDIKVEVICKSCYTVYKTTERALAALEKEGLQHGSV